MEYCQDCDRWFRSWFALKEHWVQSPVHEYCQYCDEHFDDPYEFDYHMDVDHARCEPCNRVFKNNVGLHEHYRQAAVHASRYCVPCERLFQHENNLRAHLNSSIHRSKDFVCPGYQCGMRFVSQSALVLHLEAGACPSGANRATVNRYVRQHDTNHIITDPSRMITGGGVQQEVTYYATDASWNGCGFECYLCHHEYRTLHALNQHLASPRHQDKVYVCPLSTCRERFATLSALCQHIESERCGVLRFSPRVQNTMDSVIGGMRRIAC